MVCGIVLLAQRIRIVEGKSSSRRHRGLDRSGTEVLMFFSLDFACLEGVISADVRCASVSPCLCSECHQPFYRQLVVLQPQLESCCRSVQLLLYFCHRSSSRCSISARLTPAAIRILLPFDSFPSSTLAAARMLPPLDPAVARPQSPFDSCRRSDSLSRSTLVLCVSWMKLMR